jgi:PAS domain S-box-containing protein
MTAGQILIVDDHGPVRKSLRSLISRIPGWTICGEAVDGMEAIEQAKKLLPQVVLMDISMPRMNGLDATRVLRKALPETRIILVSQNDPAIVEHQVREVDAAGFLAKSEIGTHLLPMLDRFTPEKLPKQPVGSNGAASGPSPEWLDGGGELGQLIREFDWSQTPLGPRSEWPQSLKTSVSLILSSQHPMWIGWGPGATFLYNDAYVQVLSLAKHPSALGKPAAEVWAEIWDVCGPLADQVFEKGEASFADDVRLYMSRGDFLEETYYSFSYSPIRDESGRVAGLFCPSTEVTPKVINARRLRTLSELSAGALTQKTTEAACVSAMTTLAKNADDVPFAILYLMDSDGRTAHLEQACGVPAGVGAITPLKLGLDDEKEEIAQEEKEQKDTRGVLWPLAGVMKNSRCQQVDVGGIADLPLGPAQQAISSALVLPLTSRGEDRPLGVLIAGVNPTRPLDAEYRTFYDLIAGQIATAIQNVRAAEEERKRLEALAEIDRAKTTFFSNVSHEFRTPLTLMLGPVEDLLAKSYTGLSPAAKRQLELVNRNGTRLLRLVNTLLDFSRIEAGRMQAVYQPTDLAAFTVELASVFRSATEKAGLELELHCPKLSQPVFVDRNMWEKIVLNLISNAFKFTFEGKISVKLTQDGDQVELRVGDTGVGIAAQELPRLFDRFHRIENTRSRTHEGSGIGLALVLELVKLHGGTVRAESVAGEGSTFIVSLPLGSAHLPAERIGGSRSSATTAVGAAPFVEEALRWLPDADSTLEPAIFPAEELMPVPCPPAAEGDTASAKRVRVLLADDNADMRQYLVRLLRERYEVQAFADGAAALAAARNTPPDLVLSDVMMPNLDGFGLLRALRAEQPTRTIPIILLSARAGEESRVEGMEQGADDYLIKPFSARELLARVQTHLDMARLRKQGEDALRQRSAQFATLLNESPLGVYLVDADFRLRELNPAARRLFGDRPELVGADFAEFVRARWPKDSADEILQRFHHTLETGERFYAPEWNKRPLHSPDRSIFEWQINRIPLPDGRYGVVCYFRDISHLVAAREAIAQSEERLRLATEAAELGIWMWYLDDGRATWENDRPYEIFERSKEEGPITEQEFRTKYVYADDLPAFEQAVSRAFESGSRFFSQGRIRRKNGDLAWLEFTGQLERKPDGTPWRILGTVLDITERKRAEEAIRESELRLRIAQRAAHSGTWERNLATGELFWSPELQVLWGFPPDTTIDEGMARFRAAIHPEDLDRVDQTLARLLREQASVYHAEYRLTRSDGELRWIESIGQIFYEDCGKPSRLIGVSADITERRRVEERERQLAAEAQAANAKFHAVFEQTPVFAGIMSLDGTVIDVNRLWLDACGYRAEEVLAKPFWETGWWRKSSEVQAKLRAATAQAARGTPYREVLTYHWADGSERVVEFALHPILDHEGRIAFLHPTGIDITELKRAEDNYRRLAESLDAEVQARTRELELRNADVLSQSEQLRDLSRRLLQVQDEERRRIARELHDSAGQILAALGMNLARVAEHAKAGDSRLAEATDDSQQLVQQLSQEIRTMSYLLHPPLLDETGLSEAVRWYIHGLTERNGLDIDLSVAPDFGRLSREMELVMFRLVQECLTNIHRHSGSKHAAIRMGREGESVFLQVQDDGKGISRERLAEIKAKGSGVGITGMRERVRQFGGRMEIESNGSGTTISFTLPLAIVTSRPTHSTQPVEV